MADLGLSGLASGLDWRSLVDQLMDVERAPQRQLRNEQGAMQERNNAWGSIKTELLSLQSRVTTLKDATLYDSRTAQTSESTIASATASAGAANGSYIFNITQLATASKRVGATDVGKALSPTSDVSSITLSSSGFSTAITAGTFTVNGKQVTIATTDTLQGVFDKIAAATSNAVTAAYNPTDDKIVLTGTQEVVLGSSTDTSNFLQVAKLYNNGTASVSSSQKLGGTLINGAIADSNLTTAISDGGSGAGEFKINGVSISFNTNTDSIANIITRINNSTAGVTASYDSVNDRFVLTDKNTGDVDIALQDVTGNFLAATGLASSTLQRGKNLLYTINNGDQLVSRSNTITQESSGVAGLSVNAVKEGSATIAVSTDTAKIKNAVNGFIDAYNRAQSLIETQTASSTDAKGAVTAGTLSVDSDANDIASRLRSSVFSQITGLTGVLDHLADIGISTNSETNSLTLGDSEALDNALKNNLNDVKELFSDDERGLTIGLASYLDRLVGENGSVIAKQDSLSRQSSEVDTQIKDLEKIVQANRQTMLDQFTAMETAQQRMNQQLQFLMQQLGQL
jgi:flagellar hook-associated protein 2